MVHRRSFIAENVQMHHFNQPQLVCAAMVMSASYAIPAATFVASIAAKCLKTLLTFFMLTLSSAVQGFLLFWKHSTGTQKPDARDFIFSSAMMSSEFHLHLPRYARPYALPASHGSLHPLSTSSASSGSYTKTCFQTKARELRSNSFLFNQ